MAHMTLADQLASRRALVELRNNTLSFLRSTPLFVGDLAGADTEAQQLCFALYNGVANLGGPALVAGAPHDAIIRAVAAYATPMRPGVPGPARLAATARVAETAGPPLWVTPQLSGCSVLVLDWGGTLSMVHLRPFPAAAFSWIARRFMSLSVYARQETSRRSLQRELTAIVAAARGAGPAPLRYILVQSNWQANYLGVTGVRDMAGWSFFLQSYNHDGVVNASALAWMEWNHGGRYTASAY